MLGLVSDGSFEGAAERVGYLLGVPMVGTMVASPPPNAAFDSTASDKGQEDPQWSGGRVAGVCPESMIAGGDTESREIVVDDSEQGGLPFDWSPEGCHQACQRHHNDEGDIQPINVFPPILLGYFRVGDVRFLWVIMSVPVWL